MMSSGSAGVSPAHSAVSSNNASDLVEHASGGRRTGGRDARAPRNQNFFVGSRAETFLALSARVVPHEGPTAPGATSPTTVRVAEKFVQAQDTAVRVKLGLLLMVFDWGAILRYGARFTRLSAAHQEAYLRAWERSPLQSLRFGFSSLRNLVLLAFYTQPESWSMIGYPGPQGGTLTSKQ